jgi:hypothetical protein
MRYQRDLTATHLRDVLDYDPTTGAFTWRVSRRAVRAGDAAGCVNKQGYVVIRVNGVTRKAHRLAWLHFYGESPARLVDHINGKRADNRICNLRLATNSINMQNQRRPMATNMSSGYLGVTQGRGGRWRASIVVDGKKRSLGTFVTAEEAADAYLTAKRSLHPGCSI